MLPNPIIRISRQHAAEITSRLTHNMASTYVINNKDEKIMVPKTMWKNPNTPQQQLQITTQPGGDSLSGGGWLAQMVTSDPIACLTYFKALFHTRTNMDCFPRAVFALRTLSEHSDPCTGRPVFAALMFFLLSQPLWTALNGTAAIKWISMAMSHHTKGKK